MLCPECDIQMRYDFIEGCCDQIYPVFICPKCDLIIKASY
jgi:hypothetical protein